MSTISRLSTERVHGINRDPVGTLGEACKIPKELEITCLNSISAGVGIIFQEKLTIFANVNSIIAYNWEICVCFWGFFEKDWKLEKYSFEGYEIFVWATRSTGSLIY